MKINKDKITEKHHGMWFKTRICGKLCYGRIWVIGSDVYFCQNLLNGTRPKDYPFDFDYAWVLDDEVNENVELYKSKPSDIPDSQLPTSRFKLNREYIARVKRGYIQVGCQKIKNSVIRELVKKLNG